MYDGMGRMRFSNEGVKWFAATDVSAIDSSLPVSEWWRQIIYLRGSVRLARRDTVLAAANKDGGAHVDAKLTTEYQSLMNIDGKGFWSIGDRRPPGSAEPITDAHLVFLRQMGFELLNSPELLDLCSL